MEPVEPMTLREAAQRSSRSITTLRRYIRSGRLQAEKRQGRFGPEYFVTERNLTDAGLETDPAESTTTPARRSGARTDMATVDPRAAERILRDSVPAGLYRELQMKHEQLLVQYGMMRAGGLRVLELRAELEAKQRQLEESQAQADRLRRQFARETARLNQHLRRAELEQEGRGLEVSALREKVRALEMLTRNALTSESIEKQFSDVMAQSRRVERLASRPPSTPPHSSPAAQREEPDH